MQLKTFRVDGVPFVVSPYHPGISIREDVFHRQLFVSCSGDIEYLEDFPIYGTYSIGTTLHLGRRGLIEDAMTLAGSHVAADEFDLSGCPEALSFYAELIEIHDERKRLVLTGRVSCRTVDRCEPVSSRAEVIEARKRIDELQSEIFEEMRADNFSTMRCLRKEISALEGRFVDTSWRDHAKAAIAGFSG